MVKNALQSEKAKPTYGLPQLERRNDLLDVLQRTEHKILLIEGSSGSGKTAAAQELLYMISSTREEAARRGVFFYVPKEPVTRQFEISF
jgi:Cdc6-like AAA superfamily ATPase